MEKSLNQKWKESNTTLSYKEWRKREDEKMASFDGSQVTTTRPNATAIFDKAKQEMRTLGGYKTDISNKTIFGINKYVLIVGAFLVVGAIGYKLYKSKK